VITVFAFHSFGFDALAEVTIPPLRRYCVRHGYDLVLHRGGYGNRDRSPTIQKTEMILNLLPSVEMIFSVDVDALITNHTIKLESFLDEEHDFFSTHDVNGLNTGVYFIRNTPKGRAFLASTMASAGRADFPTEQDAIRMLLSLFYMGRFFKQLPHPSINSYHYAEYGMTKTHEEGEHQPGDFILHLPGCTNERRIEVFNSTHIVE
jgi:hypothetical protein